MSSINVTNIKSRQGSAPTFPQGLNVSAGVATFAGNVTVGGTLTYDDVSNIDSVGIVTAGKGFRETTGGLIVIAGVATISGCVNVNTCNVIGAAGIVTVGAGVTISSDFIHLTDNSKINLGISSDLQIWHDGSHSQIKDAGSGGMHLWSGDFRFYNAAGTEYIIKAAENSSVDLYYDSSKKFSTVGTGVSIFGGMKVQSGLLRESVNISGTA